MADAWKTAQELSNSAIARGRSVSDCFAQILMGLEYGIGPLVAMTHLYWVGSKLTPDGPLTAALLHAEGIEWDYVQNDDKGCIISLIEPDGRRRPPIGFTEKDAKEANLLDIDPSTGRIKHDGWRKYPRDMYRWRCLMFNARHYHPEIFALYTPEELGATGIDENGAISTSAYEDYEPSPPQLPVMLPPPEAPAPPPSTALVFAPGRFRPPDDTELGQDKLVKMRDKDQIKSAYDAIRAEFGKIGGGPFNYIDEQYGFTVDAKGLRSRNYSGYRRVTITAERWRDDNLSLWIQKPGVDHHAQ